MSKALFKYGLWAATLFVAAWATALISAVVASKGGDHDPKVKSGHGRRLTLVSGKPMRGESRWAGSGADDA